MAGEAEAAVGPTWSPADGNSWYTKPTRFVSFFGYPVLIPFFLTCSRSGPPTPASARFWRFLYGSLSVVGGVWHLMTYDRLVRRRGFPVSGALHIGAQVGVWLCWDRPYYTMALMSHWLIDILGMDRSQNRLIANKLKGPRVIVIGNGPSALEGDQKGDEIDGFDEVVRFNNFQTKVAGLEKWVGTKTTVHFGDGMLSPTFKQYHVPGAAIMLSLVEDNFAVAGSYLIFRAIADYEWDLVWNFFHDPQVTWTPGENIVRLKKAIGLKGAKHPTSGMLAIDYFLNKPGVKLPVVIHGFDFFTGPTIHYYGAHEPLYERINNHFGVQMHSPHLEKIYVHKLIDEGKVIFLKDLPSGKR